MARLAWENSYVADGVGINDSGYGGIGVWSPSYGSLGTGINLSFIQEVQVKTGAFEPKYGKANGGLIQIVTKSGGSQYHGALAAYFSPRECMPLRPTRTVFASDRESLLPSYAGITIPIRLTTLPLK